MKAPVAVGDDQPSVGIEEIDAAEAITDGSKGDRIETGGEAAPYHQHDRQ